MQTTRSPAPSSGTSSSGTSSSLFGGITLAALAALIALPLILPSATLVTEIVIFAMAALACNLLLGYTGLLSFGQAIFFGIGAYLSSLVMIHLGAGLIIALVVAAIAGALAAALVGALAIRRTGIYFVMLTLAFTQLAYFIAYTAADWTGGDNGLLDVPRPPLALGGMVIADLEPAVSYYIFVAALFSVRTPSTRFWAWRRRPLDWILRTAPFWSAHCLCAARVRKRLSIFTAAPVRGSM